MATPEISLRHFDLSDVDDFMVWATDDRVSEFVRWDTYTSSEDATDFMKNVIIPHPWFKAICIDNKPIGSVTVDLGKGDSRCRAHISYALAFEYWGNGIGTLAVKMVLETIFEDWKNLLRLEAYVVAENKGSQKVLEKAGFQRDGVLRDYLILKGKTRDMVIYSFLASDRS